MEYKISFTAFIDSEDGSERFARTGWLVLNAEDDDQARSYAGWNDDGLVDVDFLDPGDHFPSASNKKVRYGQGAETTGEEMFFFAVITKVERLEQILQATPLRIGDFAHAPVES